MAYPEEVIIAGVDADLAVGAAEVFLKNVAGLVLVSDDCEKGVDTGKSKNKGVLKVSALGNAAVD